MSRQSILLSVASCIALTIAVLYVAPARAESPQTDDELWADAGQRVERYRRADVTVTVVGKDDRPVSGADVSIQQMRHAFLFGCNIFAWGRAGGEDSKALYDVIGIQSHQHGGTWTNRKIWEVCERFARFGVPLHFTETTIVSGKHGWRGNGRRREDWPTTEEGEAEQAREVERFYTMLYSHPAVEALTWWDFSDRAAWQGAPAGFLRKDMSAKPAYDVLHRLIKERWWTNSTVETDQQGTAPFRATLGDHQISVKVDGKVVATRNMTVDRGESNQLKVWLSH